jgi:NAD-dependent DNA ligase
MNQDELEWILQYHAHRYYCLDNPAITDWEYDKYYKELQKRFPHSSLLERVGQGICKELHRERI